MKVSPYSSSAQSLYGSLQQETITLCGEYAYSASWKYPKIGKVSQLLGVYICQGSTIMLKIWDTAWQIALKQKKIKQLSSCPTLSIPYPYTFLFFFFNVIFSCKLHLYASFACVVCNLLCTVFTKGFWDRLLSCLASRKELISLPTLPECPGSFCPLCLTEGDLMICFFSSQQTPRIPYCLLNSMSLESEMHRTCDFYTYIYLFL